MDATIKVAKQRMNVVRLIEIIHRLWRRLPRQVRASAGPPLQVALASLVSAAQHYKVPVSGCLSVVGCLGITSGLGESARLQLELLRRLGLSPNGVDLTAAISPDRDMLPNGARTVRTVRDQGGTAILHINPPELALAILSAKIHHSTYRIGYWAWEVEKVPPQWGAASRLVNEVWVPSTFCGTAIRQVVDVPVHVMPHPLVQLAPTESIRPRLGLSETQFVVLFAYDVLSSHARKYPEAAVQAFRRGLRGQSSARMLVKVSNLECYAPAAQLLAEAIDGDPRVTILEESLDQAQMMNLIAAADVVISLHRAEGFGLLLAQAMLAEKPVIATNWSGNCDFMNDKNSFLVPYTLTPVRDPQGLYQIGSWAEPDIDGAARYLRSCFVDKDLRRTVGENAARSIREKFGAKLEESYRSRLNALRLTSPPSASCRIQPTRDAEDQ